MPRQWPQPIIWETNNFHNALDMTRLQLDCAFCEASPALALLHLRAAQIYSAQAIAWASKEPNHA